MMHWINVRLILTFHEESMNVGPLPRWMPKVIFRLLCYVHSQSHLVQRPLILASNALQHSWTKEKKMQVYISGARHLNHVTCWF